MAAQLELHKLLPTVLGALDTKRKKMGGPMSMTEIETAQHSPLREIRSEPTYQDVAGLLSQGDFKAKDVAFNRNVRTALSEMFDADWPIARKLAEAILYRKLMVELELAVAKRIFDAKTQDKFVGIKNLIIRLGEIDSLQDPKKIFSRRLKFLTVFLETQ